MLAHFDDENLQRGIIDIIQKNKSNLTDSSTDFGLDVNVDNLITCRMPSSGMLCRVADRRTYVSEECMA
jgi:hypothetical protein